MPTICDKKDTTASSVFQPAALLREARRQKGLTTVDVPAVCILDPDGDIVRRLRQDSRSLPFDAWPCYHTRLDTFSLAGPTPYFVIIDRALRDEGTSYHYAPSSEYADADPELVAMAAKAICDGQKAVVGSSWTTDAPFRETAAAIEAARSKGVLAVEMEAAALYTFARVTGSKVLCLAHVTNTMGRTDQDFEKGEADGTAEALSILEAILQGTLAE